MWNALLCVDITEHSCELKTVENLETVKIGVNPAYVVVHCYFNLVYILSWSNSCNMNFCPGSKTQRIDDHVLHLVLPSVVRLDA